MLCIPVVTVFFDLGNRNYCSGRHCLTSAEVQSSAGEDDTDIFVGQIVFQTDLFGTVDDCHDLFAVFQSLADIGNLDGT